MKWIWISDVAAPSDEIGANGPGSDWQRIGTINSTHETDLWRTVRQHLGQLSGSARATDFYVDAEVEHPWVASLLERLPGLSGLALASEEFWLAIDIYGTGEPYLVTRKKARLVNLARRAPERHPGSLVKTALIGVRVAPLARRGVFRSLNVG
ncbi:hypothetical protein ACFTSF_37660 [Kribbella sp. NPDC056951]|uniref:hypothetical protein n=1 Tax=Kribbella sp. NPDC056951 TaxID=3345978 RepID=UPI003627B39E